MPEDTAPETLRKLCEELSRFHELSSEKRMKAIRNLRLRKPSEKNNDNELIVHHYNPQTAYALFKVLYAIINNDGLFLSDAVSMFLHESNIYISVMLDSEIDKFFVKKCNRTLGRLRKFLLEELPVKKMAPDCLGLINMKNNQSCPSAILTLTGAVIADDQKTLATEQYDRLNKGMHIFFQNACYPMPVDSEYFELEQQFFSNNLNLIATEKKTVRIKYEFDDYVFMLPLRTKRQKLVLGLNENDKDHATRALADFLGFGINNEASDDHKVSITIPRSRVCEILELQFARTGKKYFHLSFPLLLSIFEEASKEVGLKEDVLMPRKFSTFPSTVHALAKRNVEYQCSHIKEKLSEFAPVQNNSIIRDKLQAALKMREEVVIAFGSKIS